MAQAISPDPPIPIEEQSAPEMDFPAHVRMFNRVLRTAKWFAIHVLIVLVALYSLAIAHQPGVGFVLIAFAIGLLVFGTRRRSSVRKDVSLALEAGPTAPESHIRDPRDFER